MLACLLISKSDNTTTTRPTYAFTYRYCALEVAKSAKRNRKSDVFSLGCIFTEILAILDPRTKLENVEAAAYHKSIDDIRDALKHSKTISLRWSELIRISIDMLEPEPSYRISAGGLVNELILLERPKSNLPFKYFCDSCALKALKEGPLEALSGRDP